MSLDNERRAYADAIREGRGNDAASQRSNREQWGLASTNFRLAEFHRAKLAHCAALALSVKSLLGERLPTLRVISDGVDGDRMWGIQDRSDGRILNARREPRLLFASSRVAEDGEVPVITLPDGQELTGPGPGTDAALSVWLAKAVTLVSAAENDAAHAEYFADATDDSSQSIEWTMPKERFVDAFPVLVLTTAGLRAGAAAHSSGT